ncbi:MAG: Txe/YoeB family addiction module toxin [Tannerella sp.]|jgi:toxin YoeB|nr:Txe/YoeB family addiction module toxin [Tannerella sp.]
MTYCIEFSDDALEDIVKLKKSEKGAYEKLRKLLEELAFHPRSGTGKPKILEGDLKGCWSRRITSKHRLIYTVNDAIVTVLVASAYGHYGDK